MEEQYLVLSEGEVIELLAYLITSARGLLHEETAYGPLRLLTAAQRLSNLVLPRASDQAVPFLTMLIEEIPVWQRERKRDPGKYAAFIDEGCIAVARELKHRELESEGAYE